MPSLCKLTAMHLMQAFSLGEVSRWNASNDRFKSERLQEWIKDLLKRMLLQTIYRLRG